MAQTLHAKAIIQAVDHVSGPLANIARSFGALQGRLDRSIGMVGRTAASAGRALTVGVTAPAALAVRSFVQYQDALLDLQKVFPGTSEQMEGLTRQIDRMARVVPLSRVQLTQLAEAASRANIPFKEIPQFMQLAAEFSVAFGLSADESAGKLAKLKTALGLSIPELRDMSDSMNILANNSAATEGDILEVVRRVAALTKSIGGTGAAKQLSALGGAMVASGVDAEVAGTGIRNMWLNLTKGDSATKAIRNSLKELGLAAPAVAKALTKDTFGTVLDLLERIDKKAPDVRARILGDLFGKRAVDALGPLVGNLEEFRRQLDLVNDKTKRAGSTQKEYLQRLKGLSADLQLLRNDLTGIAQVIVHNWLPSIRSAIGSLRSFLQGFSDQPAIVRWAAQITGALALAGPVLWAFGAGLQGLVSIVGGVGTAFAGLAALGAVWLAPLVALAVIGIALYRNWDLVGPAFNRVATAGGNLFSALGRLIGLDSEALSDLSGIFDGWDLGIAQTVATVLNKIADSLERLAALVDRFRGGDILGGLKDWGGGEFKMDFKNSPIGVLLNNLNTPSDASNRSLARGDLFGEPAAAPGGPSVPVVPRKGPGVPGMGPEYRRALDDISKTFKGALLPGKAGAPSMPSIPPVPQTTEGLVRDITRGPAGPRKIDVTGKVTSELKGKGEVNVRVQVEGPGRVTGITTSGGGKNLELNAGTTMQDTSR